MDCSLPGSSVHGIVPWGKNIGVGCHFLLQGIFPTQGSNLGFLHWQQILYHRATREVLRFIKGLQRVRQDLATEHSRIYPLLSAKVHLELQDGAGLNNTENFCL